MPFANPYRTIDFSRVLGEHSGMREVSHEICRLAKCVRPRISAKPDNKARPHSQIAAQQETTGLVTVLRVLASMTNWR